jgi:hypothetical protein
VGNDDDCCDINTGVNPGVTGWYTGEYSCGTTVVDFDWNCSGVEEQRWMAIGDCTWDPTSGACVATPGWLISTGTTIPYCGVLGTWLGGCLSISPGTCSPGAVMERRQECH